jgi:protein-S-isoprenylcysteine O-methyltransferase Ste14
MGGRVVRILEGVLAPLPLLVMFATLLLAPAGLACGVWVWPRAWGFLGVYGALSIAGYVALAVARPASFRVRQQGVVARREKRQPLIDALGLTVYFAFAAAWFAFIPIDVFRLRLFPAPVSAISLAGGVAAVAGVAITFLAIAQNQFAAPTIHDQTKDGQRVIDTGLYAIVRHPFYAGMLLIYAGMALCLGSYAAAIGVIGFLLLTLARIVIEEAYLREHLPAYPAYAGRVRRRLIPYLL